MDKVDPFLRRSNVKPQIHRTFEYFIKDRERNLPIVITTRVRWKVVCNLVCYLSKWLGD